MAKTLTRPAPSEPAPSNLTSQEDMLLHIGRLEQRVLRLERAMCVLVDSAGPAGRLDAQTIMQDVMSQRLAEARAR